MLDLPRKARSGAERGSFASALALENGSFYCRSFRDFVGILRCGQNGGRRRSARLGLLRQNLRHLVTDGAPPKNTYASDWASICTMTGKSWWQTLYRPSFSILTLGLEKLKGCIDIIIENQFLHLFDWKGQIAAMKTIVKLSKARSMSSGSNAPRRAPRKSEDHWDQCIYVILTRSNEFGRG